MQPRRSGYRAKSIPHQYFWKSVSNLDSEILIIPLLSEIKII